MRKKTLLSIIRRGLALGAKDMGIRYSTSDGNCASTELSPKECEAVLRFNELPGITDDEVLVFPAHNPFTTEIWMPVDLIRKVWVNIDDSFECGITGPSDTDDTPFNITPSLTKSNWPF